MRLYPACSGKCMFFVNQNENLDIDIDLIQAKVLDLRERLDPDEYQNLLNIQVFQDF